MSGRRKLVIWVIAVVTLLAIAVGILANRPRTRPLSLAGAVMRQDPDPKKELPLADVEVAALSNDSVIGNGKSDASGFFTIVLRTRLWIGRPVTLQFRHADYQPLTLKDFIGDKVYLAKMVPIPHDTTADKRPEIVVSNLQVRYSIKTTTTANVGSAVQAFEVANMGNVPCAKRPPCSPDGKWKATVGSKSLDAGEKTSRKMAGCSGCRRAIGPIPPPSWSRPKWFIPW
jgi:hypothetical protein